MSNSKPKNPSGKPELRDLLSLKEVTKEYSWCSERRLRRYVHERRIDYCKVGRNVFFDPAVIEAIPEIVPAIRPFCDQA